MIFQRRFHSHTPTTAESLPTPPSKDITSPPKTLEEILAIAVSPRAPKPPPHAVGTIAGNPQIVRNTPLRSVSTPLKSNVPRRAPSSRKTGHATIYTDGIDGHDAFESDAFAVHMPTTRIPIIDAPVSQSKSTSPTKAQAEAVRTYQEKAKQARERNNSIGVRVPPNIASYDYAYANTSKKDAAIPAVLKPSSSPHVQAGAFPVSPPLPQEKRAQPEPKSEPVFKKSKISSNTSVFHKPTVLGVTTAATVVEESVQYLRADANGGALRPSSPPKSTTVKISMKPRSPPAPKAPPLPTIKVEACEAEPHQGHTCQVEHCRGIYYRNPYLESITTSCSPSSTKTMPNFTCQHLVEGDSIFGYKVRDPLITVAGADKPNSSSSKNRKPNATTSKTQNSAKQSPPKRTLTDRWPWIRKGAAIGKPPSTPAPDPPVKVSASKRPMSTYTSPFEDLASPPTTSPPVRPTPLRSAAAAVAAKAATTKTQPASPKKAPAVPRSTALPAPATSSSFEAGLQQIQSFIGLTVKIGLALYVFVALWFILDAVRDVLYVLCVPLRLVLVFTWAIVSFVGKGLGVVAGSMGGKIRVLGR